MSTFLNAGSNVSERAARNATSRRFLTFGLSFVLASTLLTLATKHYSHAAFAGFWLWQLVLVLSILFVSGLMSGLSGFGFSAVGSACLLLIPPTLAVPLLMALSTANQFMSIGQLREDMPKSWKEAWPQGPGPYILGGVVGAPIGIWLLNHLPAFALMLAFGIILTAYSIYSLIKPAGRSRGHSGAVAGVIVGFIGGVFGGFTAFPGAAVVVWTGLRNLPKHLTRSIVQPYILALQVLSLLTNALMHPSVFGARFWILLAVTIPVVLPGTIGGVMLYKRVSDMNFRRVSFLLLGLSGAGLLIKVLLR